MSPEVQIAATATFVVVVYALWQVGRWFFVGKSVENPWDETTEQSIQQPDAVPLCRRCLEPHEPADRYCSHCGLPVDSMVPLSPFHQVFAIGDILLTGTQRRFPVNWLTITGYVLLSAIQYAIFAPFYWYFLLRNVRRLRASPPPPVDREEISQSHPSAPD